MRKIQTILLLILILSCNQTDKVDNNIVHKNTPNDTFTIQQDTLINNNAKTFYIKLDSLDERNKKEICDSWTFVKKIITQYSNKEFITISNWPLYGDWLNVLNKPIDTTNMNSMEFLVAYYKIFDPDSKKQIKNIECADLEIECISPDSVVNYMFSVDISTTDKDGVLNERGRMFLLKKIRGQYRIVQIWTVG